MTIFPGEHQKQKSNFVIEGVPYIFTSYSTKTKYTQNDSDWLYDDIKTISYKTEPHIRFRPFLSLVLILCDSKRTQL